MKNLLKRQLSNTKLLRAKMRVGYGCGDITPRRPVPLCGFASRCEAPYAGVDDPLHVHALAVEAHGQTVVLLVYDLLALGAEIHAEILASLREIRYDGGTAPEWVLCATHTHSAPAAITLLGCGEPQRDYWDGLILVSRSAAEAALAALRPARLRWTTVQLPDHNYNRRRILMDGRVVMAREPDTPVRKTGPVCERLLLARFDDDEGRGIAGIASWAAHAVTVCGLNVTADFPGELCRRLSEQQGFPFLYLQGACGNLNPVFTEMTRGQMLANVDAITTRILPIQWPGAAASVATCGLVRRSVPLAYMPLPTIDELHRMKQGMASIANTGAGLSETMKILADILNVKPGSRPADGMARHIASILRRWCDSTLPISEKGDAGPCQLEIAVWRLGELVFGFVAAEVFAETALRLQARFPDEVVTLVGYMSPLVGYLPTDEALDEGGYESAYAYRFYNHPAPFARGSEDALLAALSALSVKQGESYALKRYIQEVVPGGALVNSNWKSHARKRSIKNLYYTWSLERPRRPAMPSSYFWTWDHSTNWALDDPGLQADGCYNRYLKQPDTYLEDYRRLIDMSAGLGIPGIIIWGFLRDSHGGVEYAKQVAKYAASQKVAIYPGVGTTWYGGVYYEGQNSHALGAFQREHQDAVILNEKGTPYTFNGETGVCPAHPAYREWLTDAMRWLFCEFKIGGVSIENGDFMVDHNPMTQRLLKKLKWPQNDPPTFQFQGLCYHLALDAICDCLADNLCTYATYTGFNYTETLKQNTGIGKQPPAMLSRLPALSVAQWTISGMLLKKPLPLMAWLDTGTPDAAFDNQNWPADLRAPAPRNTGFLHQGSQWWGHQSGRYECIISTIKEACLRGYRSGLEGISIHGEVSNRHIPSALNYLAFSHFIHWPEDSLREFGRKTLGPVLGLEEDGMEFIELLAHWEAGVITDAERVRAAPEEHGFKRVTCASQCDTAAELQIVNFWNWLKYTVRRETGNQRRLPELLWI